jgi:ribA/ribD-fused uncharacterized protein
MKTLPLSREELERQVIAGEKFKYLCFWGHRVPADGAVTASCLSQWYPAPFEMGGVRFATAEHFMMVGKAKLFSDNEIVSEIVDAASPGAAKALGRKVRNFDAAIWNRHCLDIVTAGNIAKFGQNEAMKQFLLSTGDRVLVEASPVDRVWGIGLSKSHEDAEKPQRWRGQNLLGFALMRARTALMNGES